MKDLEEIRGRCVIDEDGHWLWRGSLRPDGRANIYAPDYTLGGMRVQCGTRAVWHCSTGKPIPKGWRAYGTCDEKTCCNPGHVACTSMKKLGQFITEKGIFKGQTRRILANREIQRKRTKMNPELMQYILQSELSGIELSKELNIARSLVSRVRTGQFLVFQSASPFGGLGA